MRSLRKCVFSPLLAAAVLISILPAHGLESRQFADVPLNHWAYAAVAWAVEGAVTKGTSDTTFSPNDTCTVEQILTLLWRAYQSPMPTAEDIRLEISEKEYYHDAVLWAFESGLIPSSPFQKGIPCTRSMALTFLWKLAGSPSEEGPAFKDVPVDAEYRTAVSWGINHHITTGTGEGVFSPDQICTRGEIVTFLYRSYLAGQLNTIADTRAYLRRYNEVRNMLLEAREQFLAQDHTPLPEPVDYRILWLGFPNVSYDGKNYSMHDFDREYLDAITVNFEQVVEEYAQHNVDIQVDLRFIEDTVPLTKQAGKNWIYLSHDTAQTFIDPLLRGGQYDTVLTTTVQAKDLPHQELGGLEQYGVENTVGYSTFSLWGPYSGTWPLEDPAVPSLYGTALAVHEWLHQLELLKDIMEIEFPPCHAYAGGQEYPGYLTYNANENNYDYFEFYSLILSGRLPYSDGKVLQEVGMYPKMWRLIKGDALNIGTALLRSEDGEAYLSAQEGKPNVTANSTPTRWLLRYAGADRVALIPTETPMKRVDLHNARDQENNIVKLEFPTRYIDAQRWSLSQNPDGTITFRTDYESGRAITVEAAGAQAVIKDAETPTIAQKWVLQDFQPTKPW